VAAAAAPPPPVPADVEEPEGSEHRHHAHGGIGALIAMSLKDLDLTADQRTAVEKIKTDLSAKLEPAKTASKDVAGLLADGVAAGKVDRVKTDAAIGKMTAQVQLQQDASLDALNQLHAALTPAQRTSLSDALVAHFAKWREAQGHDEQDDGKNRSGHLLGLVKDLGISRDQAQQIKASFKTLLKASPQEAEPPKVEAHLKGLADGFKKDTFDARTLKTTPSAGASMAKWGSTRMARFLEAAAPILTADQRTKLAEMIRARAS
jgi:Spy/CpxP family protein refolding chaperone